MKPIFEEKYPTVPVQILIFNSKEIDCHLSILWGVFLWAKCVRIPVRIASSLRIRMGRFIVFPFVSNLLLPLIALPEIYRDIAKSYRTTDVSIGNTVDWQFCAVLGKVLRSAKAMFYVK